MEFPTTEKIIKTITPFENKEKIGCTWIPLGKTDSHLYALVFGYGDVDPYPDREVNAYVYKRLLCGKIARIPHNSGMQCDYDVDWEMPFEKDGYVHYTDLVVELDVDVSGQREFWKMCWNAIQEYFSVESIEEV